MNVLKYGARIIGSLLTSGALSAGSQWATQELRENNNHLIREAKRGGEHTARKLKLIKND